MCQKEYGAENCKGCPIWKKAWEPPIRRDDRGGYNHEIVDINYEGLAELKKQCPSGQKMDNLPQSKHVIHGGF